MAKMIKTRSTSISDPPPRKSLQEAFKKDNYRFSDQLSISSSTISSSMEQEYYYKAVSVPFRWESQPGTPKIRLNEKPLPPLTPPPSYYYHYPQHSSSPNSPLNIKNKNCSSKKSNNLLDAIFPKRSIKKKNLPISSPVSSSSSSNSSYSSPSSPWSKSYSVPTSPMRPSEFRGRAHAISSPRFSFDSRVYRDGAGEEYESTTTLCFVRGGNGVARSRGCYASVIKVLLRDSS